jgi:hypothetical protein
MAILDPVESSEDVVTTKAGYHFVGVELTLRNVGTGRWSESPTNGSSLTGDQCAARAASQPPRPDGARLD